MATTALRITSSMVVIVALAAALLAASAAPAEAYVRPTAEVLMVHRINQARAAYGLAPLTSNLQMKRIARQWSYSMAVRNQVQHRTNLAEVVDGNFVRLAENVGFSRLEGASDSTLVDRLHAAFMRSDGHRAQILGSFNMVGVGVQRLSGGRMYVTVNFLQGALDGFPLYRDAANSPDERAIGSLFVRNAIRGCYSNRFCPAANASRTYVATVLNRAGRTYAASKFLGDRCGTSSACRNGEITRAELAEMVTYVLRLNPGYGTRFTDVSDADQAAVYAVVREGIMGGCSASRFCPGTGVSRARAASVIYRAVR